MSFLEIYELRKQISNIYQQFLFLKIKSKICTERYTNLIRDFPELSRQDTISHLSIKHNITTDSAKILLYEAILDIHDIAKKQIELKVDASILLKKLRDFSQDEYYDMYKMLEEYIK
jgi:hypothetical protein